MHWDAWDIDIFYQDKRPPVTAVSDIKVIETGPLRATIHVTRTYGRGTSLVQRISIYRDLDRIDFDMQIDWVCGHKWADLSEGNHGVSLLSDSKYRWDIRDNVLLLTLFKGAIYPDADLFIRLFETYGQRGTAALIFARPVKSASHSAEADTKNRPQANAWGRFLFRVTGASPFDYEPLAGIRVLQPPDPRIAGGIVNGTVGL